MEILQQDGAKHACGGKDVDPQYDDIESKVPLVHKTSKSSSGSSSGMEQAQSEKSLRPHRTAGKSSYPFTNV